MDDRLKAHIFIVMLAYYLQWHFLQRIKPLFDNDGVGDERRWSLDIIIKRLKSITKSEQLIGDIVVISKPDMNKKRF